MHFSTTQQTRYARHLNLPDFGAAAQLRLAQARVAVIGCGGLGVPVLQYLTAAGVGRLRLIDGDDVALSNLQRQVLFCEEDLGKPKARQAAKHLRARNSEVKFEVFEAFFSKENQVEILEGCDLVLDCSDNFETRYTLDAACRAAELPWVYGGLYRFEGQVACFNLLLQDGSRSASYADFFPPSEESIVPNCAEDGVLGVLPGIIGNLQALEALKVLTGFAPPICNSLLLFDGVGLQLQRIQLFPTQTEVFFPKIKLEKFSLRKEEIAWRKYLCIDLRETHERKILPFPKSLHLPVGEAYARLGEVLVNEERPVLFACQSGKRSAEVLRWAKATFPAREFFHLEGGLSC